MSLLILLSPNISFSCVGTDPKQQTLPFQFKQGLLTRPFFSLGGLGLCQKVCICMPNLVMLITHFGQKRKYWPSKCPSRCVRVHHPSRRKKKKKKRIPSEQTYIIFSTDMWTSIKFDAKNRRRPHIAEESIRGSKANLQFPSHSYYVAKCRQAESLMLEMIQFYARILLHYSCAK